MIPQVIFSALAEKDSYKWLRIHGYNPSIDFSVLWNHNTELSSQTWNLPDRDLALQLVLLRLLSTLGGEVLLLRSDKTWQSPAPKIHDAHFDRVNIMYDEVVTMLGIAKEHIGGQLCAKAGDVRNAARLSWGISFLRNCIYSPGEEIILAISNKLILFFDHHDRVSIRAFGRVGIDALKVIEEYQFKKVKWA